MSVGLFLGIIVGLVGYGRVLPVYLVVRVLLVVLGTTLTIVGATKIVNLLVGEQQMGTTSPQVKEVDLGNLENVGNEGQKTETEGTGDFEGSEGTTDDTDPATDLEEDAEIEELADMVSETMKDEETET